MKGSPFKNLVLSKEEWEIEESIARGEWKSVKKPKNWKKELQKAATNTLGLRKSKRITFRINQGDLIKLKARAKAKSIPYQTLLTALIRSYVVGSYSVKL